jgi:hypothetical protein
MLGQFCSVEIQASGLQAFVGALYNSISRTLGPELSEDCDAISKTLFGEWLRKHQADSLRLSADEERRYALRYGDPKKASDKPRTELGANALAGLGLSSLFMVGRQNGWHQVGYLGSRGSGEVTWPIFQTPGGAPLAVIVCIMALQETEVAPGFGTKGLSGGGGCSVMVDGADDEETETEVRCRREGEDSA